MFTNLVGWSISDIASVVEEMITKSVKKDNILLTTRPKRISRRGNPTAAFVMMSFTIVVFLLSAFNPQKKTENIQYQNVPIRYIYLSFDDGPLNGSENIDSVILAEKLKISVFIVGENAEESKRLGNYYKLYEENPFVEVYNHSYTHAKGKYRKFYSHPENVLADIQKNEQLFGLRYKIVRLPGRNMWRVGGRKRDDIKSGSSSADLLAQNGYKVYGWDIEWQHRAKDGTPIQSVDEMETEIVRLLGNGETFTKDHLVLLVHDEMFQKKWEESELKLLIDRLRLHQNFLFEHLRFYPDK